MMIRLYRPLARFAGRLSLEGLCAAISLFFGGFVSVFRSFEQNPGFGTIAGLLQVPGVPAEYIFALPLIAGAALQILGRRRRSTGLRAGGALCGIFTFSTACASCWIANHTGTGVPAYACLCGLYLALFFWHVLGIEWVPLA